MGGDKEMKKVEENRNMMDCGEWRELRAPMGTDLEQYLTICNNPEQQDATQNTVEHLQQFGQAANQWGPTLDNVQ